MHVDGFRFDLASTLAREFYDVDRLSVFFDLVQQDPVVSQVKLIAEPWDLGDGGYQVGGFPPLWTEWNGRYRDTVRDFWREESASLPEFASRITGSSDLYESSGRRPIASVNFVTAHDGFTLRDLVSYNQKHNEANGENNADGENHNRSWNCGVEGETRDRAVRTLRARQQRNFLTTLLLSQGVPMILHGDEIGRTQRGNNNAYCQDNEIAWVDWRTNAVDKPLLEFAGRLVELRKKHPVFRRRRFFEGHDVRGARATDEIAWFRPDGRAMGGEDWTNGHALAVCVFLNGSNMAEVDYRGEALTDDSFLLLMNGHGEAIEFVLPDRSFGREWRVELDTSDDAAGTATAEPRLVRTGTVHPVTGHGLVLLRRES
jgi:glycogen operon protein